MSGGLFTGWQTMAYLTDAVKQPIPANLVQQIGVRVERKPYKHGLAYYMVCGHEAPEARVLRVVAVVAHHKVVILLNRIAG